MAAKSYAIGTKFTAKDGVSGVIKNLRSNLNGFEKQVTRAKKKTRGLLHSMKGVAGGIIGANLLTRAFRGVTGQLGSLITEAGKIEDIVARFVPLMKGSYEKAEKFVAKLNKTAATTPYQLEDISKNVELLYAVLEDDDKSIEMFRKIGDIAGGSVANLQSITRAYGRVKSKGFLQIGQLDMIGDTGVDIYGALSETLGVSKDKLQEMLTNKEVTAEHLEKTFDNLTKKDGKYYQGMLIASKTLSGVFSTLSDNTKQVKGDIGKYFLEPIKNVALKIIEISGSIREFMEANKEMIDAKVAVYLTRIKNLAKDFVKVLKYAWDILKENIIFVGKSFLWFSKSVLPPALRILWKWRSVIVGITIILASYKLALIAVAAKQKTWLALLAVGKLFKFAKGVLLVAKAEGALAAIQSVLNTIMLANPFGLVVIAVAALIAVVFLLIKYWKQIVDWFKRGWEWIKEIGAAFVDLVKNFSVGKLIGLFRKIYGGVMNFLLMPLKGVLALLAKIPGVGGIAQLALDSLDSVIDGISGNSDALKDTEQSQIIKSENTQNNVSVDFNNVPENATVTVPAATSPAVQIGVHRVFK